MNELTPNPSLVFSLIGTAHAIEGRLESALEGIGLSLAKFGVLDQMALARSPLSLSELADRSGCVRSNITQMVDRLAADGLVERVPDTEDRRVIRAQLTAPGLEKHRVGAGILSGAQDDVVAGLPESDQASLRWVLRRLG